jgi:uncharacterized caspase-like protein
MTRLLLFGFLLIALPALAQEPSTAKNIVREKLAGQFDAGKKWAIVIGVNDYLDPAIPKLKYCVADAKLVAQRLVSRCGYEADRVLVITDDQTRAHLRPLRINLDKQIRGWLSKAEKGDTVVVFFSGHGELDAKGQGFLVPQDCDPETLETTSYPVRQLRDQLHQCAATQKLLVLDCCHSGGEKDTGPAVGPSSQELGQAFQAAEGLITLASCRKKEKSQEWPAKQQGLFTYFLATGLAGAADYDRNNIIDSDELYRYTADQVPLTAQRELNASGQTPVRIIGEDVVGPACRSRGAPFHAKPAHADANAGDAEPAEAWRDDRKRSRHEAGLYPLR